MPIDACERCHRGVDILLALENRGNIYKWVCEKCWFNNLKAQKRREEGKKDLIPKDFYDYS